MTETTLDYSLLTEKAMRSVIRAALEIAARDGLPGLHHFYLTIDTTYPNVEISASLRSEYKEEITIVLENQFWDLTVEKEWFSVVLKFGRSPQKLKIPFQALTRFVDPSVNFVLQFTQGKPVAPLKNGIFESNERGDSVSGERELAMQSSPSNKESKKSADVVKLDKFRRKD